MTQGDNKMDKTFDEQVKEKRAEMLDKMAPRADRILNDQKLSRFRGHGIRRLLALIMFTLCLTLVWTYSMVFISILVMATIIALWFFLSRINRGFMDLPEELVDERIRARRDGTYRWAYLGACGIVLSLTLLTIIQNNSGETVLGTEPISGFTALIWTLLTLPTIIFTWMEKEI